MVFHRCGAGFGEPLSDRSASLIPNADESQSIAVTVLLYKRKLIAPQYCSDHDCNSSNRGTSATEYDGDFERALTPSVHLPGLTPKGTHTNPHKVRESLVHAKKLRKSKVSGESKAELSKYLVRASN